jgi:hypothetical protein
MKDYVPARGGYLAIFEQPSSSELFLNRDMAFKTHPIVHVAREFECWASCLNGQGKIAPHDDVPYTRVTAAALAQGIRSALQRR